MGFDKLIKTKFNTNLFTTPSHSQRFCIFNKFRHFYSYDISETDTHNPEEMLEEAERFAANVYKTKQTKFLTNGSTSGILASVISVVSGCCDNILLWSNSHKCHLNAVKLAGANPIFYNLENNKDFGVPRGLKPEDIEPYFKNFKIKAVIVTSPSYEGYVSDIKGIKELCNNYGAYLIVDEAHGALYPFSDKLPESAIKYADFVVQSLHKTAGGLNPTALLHVNCDIDLKLDMISTTSPSYPLLLTIEKNIKYLNSSRGKKELSKLINNIIELRESLTEYDFGGDDITKLLIKKEGLSGFDLSEKLYSFNIEDEKTNELSTLLLTGIGTKKEKLDKLKLALKRI